MTLGSLCRVGRNAHDRSVCTPSPAKNAAALTLAWCRVIRAGFALPRVRAGSRPSSPGGGSKPFLPLRRWPYAISSVGGGVRAETGAIPAIGVFAAAALRAAVPAGGRRSKPSSPWRRQLYALSGPSALSACARGCYSRQPVGGRCPPSTPRHGDQRPRVTRNRHPRQQVTMPWRALRAVSMRNAGSASGEPGRPVQPRPSWGGMSHFPAGYTTPRAGAAKAPTPPGAAALPCSSARRTSRRRVPGAGGGSRLRVRSARLP